MQFLPTLTERAIPRVFDELISRIEQANGHVKMARIDLKETPQEYIITADLPGFTKKDIELSLSNQVLTICADHKGEKKEKAPNYILHERRCRTFRRSIPVKTSQSENVDAEFKNGVLEIRVRKTSEQKGKQIRVQ